MKLFLRITAALLSLVALVIIIFYQPDIPVHELKAKYAVAPSQFVNLFNDYEVHFRDEGPTTDSIPLVLLHGTSSSLLTWDACTQEWAKDNRVIRMDLPAFGITGPHPQDDYSVDAYVTFLHEFLKAKGIRKCIVVGNSLGGLIAYTYTFRYPSQVDKLILIDAAGYPKVGGKGNLAFTLGKVPVLNKVLTIITPLSLVRRSIEDVYGDKSKVTDELVMLYRDMACRTGNRQALLQRLKFDQLGDTTLLPRIQQPTLIIWGDQDQLIPVANAYKFQRDLPNNQLVILKGQGHVPMEESPEIVIPLVRKFIGN